MEQLLSNHISNWILTSLKLYVYSKTDFTIKLNVNYSFCFTSIVIFTLYLNFNSTELKWNGSNFINELKNKPKESIGWYIRKYSKTWLHQNLYTYSETYKIFCHIGFGFYDKRVYFFVFLFCFKPTYHNNVIIKTL